MSLSLLCSLFGLLTAPTFLDRFRRAFLLHAKVLMLDRRLVGPLLDGAIVSAGELASQTRGLGRRAITFA